MTFVLPDSLTTVLARLIPHPIRDARAVRTAYGEGANQGIAAALHGGGLPSSPWSYPDTLTGRCDEARDRGRVDAYRFTRRQIGRVRDRERSLLFKRVEALLPDLSAEFEALGSRR